MAFSKKKVEDRKRWLSSFVPGTYLDQSVDKISYADFVNKVRMCCGVGTCCMCLLHAQGCNLMPCCGNISSSHTLCCV